MNQSIKRERVDTMPNQSEMNQQKDVCQSEEEPITEKNNWVNVGTSLLQGMSRFSDSCQTIQRESQMEFIAIDSLTSRTVTILIRREYFPQAFEKICLAQQLSKQFTESFVGIEDCWIAHEKDYSLIFIVEQRFDTDLKGSLQLSEPTLQEKLSYSHQILQGLAYLQANTFVHGNINLQAFSVNNCCLLLHLSYLELTDHNQQLNKENIFKENAQQNQITEQTIHDDLIDRFMKSQDKFNIDVLSAGIVLCMIDNGMSEDNLSKILSSFDKGQFNNEFDISRTSILYQVSSAMLTDSSKPIQFYIDLLVSLSEIEKKKGVLLIKNPSIIINSYIDSLQRCVLKKSDVSQSDRESARLQPSPSKQTVSSKADDDHNISHSKDIVIEINIEKQNELTSEKISSPTPEVEIENMPFDSMLVQYKELIQQMNVDCDQIEQIIIYQGFEQANGCLYFNSCVLPISFVRLLLRSRQNPLIGKNFIQVLLIPFIKIFNKAWLFKSKANCLMNIIQNILLWVLKVINIVFMICLISAYFFFLLVFVVLIYSGYLLIQMIVLVVLLPLGLLRFYDRLSVKLRDHLSSVIYDRQKAFIWYSLDPNYTQAQKLLLLHNNLLKYQYLKHSQKLYP